jgi:hypothetical protein
MTKCSYCGTTIFMGGVRSGDQRFCNKNCLQNARLLTMIKNIPSDVLDRKIEEVWRGNCPKCRSLGPIELHKAYDVWSVLVLTRWSTKSQISCRSCGTKRQIGAAAFSFFFGWWGFPWGIVLTPIQISRNVIGMIRGPDPSRPSDDLRRAVLSSLLMNVGAQTLAKQKTAANPPSASTS